MKTKTLSKIETNRILGGTNQPSGEWRWNEEKQTWEWKETV